jgi:hypothetical protein
MSQNIFCSKCHRIPSQCCCSSAKELTDEEMLEVYKKLFNKKNEFRENLKRRSYFDFARAILQKASEK